MSAHGPPHPHPRLLTALAVLAVLGHLYGLYRPQGPPTPSWFAHADKVEHLVGFGGPVFLVLLACRTRPGRPDRFRLGTSGTRVRDRHAAWVAAAFAAHAVVSELVQHYFYAHRTGDPYDVVADLAGVALGLAAAQLGRSRSRTRQPAGLSRMAR